MIDQEDASKGFVNIRVGFHSGPVLANIIGSRNPKYTLIGDTVNMSSRMESNSLPGRVLCSERAAALLRDQCSECVLTSRGFIEVKGKGAMETFWVTHAIGNGNGSKNEIGEFDTTENTPLLL